jgi:hypothetical protein
MKKLALGIVGALLVAGSGLLVFQHQSQARLRDEIASLRRHTSQIVRLQREHQRLAGLLVPQEELDNLRNGRQELARLRLQLVNLRTRVQIEALAQSVHSVPRPLAPGMVPIENLVDAGAGTPTAAAQTFFWAIAQADPDAMVNQLVFSEASRAKAEKLLAALDDDTRAKINTPEKLMALYLVGLLGRVSGMQVSDQEDQGTDRAVWNVKLQMASGRLKDYSFPVQRSADGWREEIPAGMVDHWSYYLLRTK